MSMSVRSSILYQVFFSIIYTPMATTSSPWGLALFVVITYTYNTHHKLLRVYMSIHITTWIHPNFKKVLSPLNFHIIQYSPSLQFCHYFSLVSITYIWLTFSGIYISWRSNNPNFGSYTKGWMEIFIVGNGWAKPSPNLK